MDGPAEAVAQIQSEELDINTDPPSISEIVRSIKKLINGKKPGSENIQTEVLKADIEVLSAVMYRKFHKMWMDEEISSDWQKGIIIKLPKILRIVRWVEMNLIRYQSRAKHFAEYHYCEDNTRRRKETQKKKVGYGRGRSSTFKIFVLRNTDHWTIHGMEWHIRQLCGLQKGFW